MNTAKAAARWQGRNEHRRRPIHLPFGDGTSEAEVAVGRTVVMKVLVERMTA